MNPRSKRVVSKFRFCSVSLEITQILTSSWTIYCSISISFCGAKVKTCELSKYITITTCHHSGAKWGDHLSICAARCNSQVTIGWLPYWDWRLVFRCWLYPPSIRKWVCFTFVVGYIFFLSTASDQPLLSITNQFHYQPLSMFGHRWMQQTRVALDSKRM